MKHTKTLLCTGLALVMSSNALLIHADEPTSLIEKQPLFFNTESKPVNSKEMALTIQKGHRKFVTPLLSDPNSHYQFETTDAAIASISENGLILGLKKGKTTVNIKSKDTSEIVQSISIDITEDAVDSHFITMESRWQERAVGDESINLNDKHIQDYIQVVDGKADDAFSTLDQSPNPEFPWANEDNKTVAAHNTRQFTNLKSIAIAFGTYGSKYYQDEATLNFISTQLDFLINDQMYGSPFTVPTHGNWWDWQIGIPMRLLDILSIVNDYIDQEDITRYLKGIEVYNTNLTTLLNGAPATGANKTDVGLIFLGVGIMKQDASLLDYVNQEMPEVVQYVSSGDGLYKDGSLVQHKDIAYLGTYGNDLVKGIGKIASIVADTPWAMDPATMQNIYTLIDEGYIPLMYKGKMMSMVNGRSISRAPYMSPTAQEFDTGKESIANIMLIADAAPEPLKSTYKQHLKEWIIASDRYHDYFSRTRDFESLVKAKQIFEDESIQTLESTQHVKIYGSMDRVVNRNHDYTAALSMFSKRISNYESINNENMQGWHTGSGMLYLYTDNDIDQYDGTYWAAVDKYRLPGTTVDTRPLANKALHRKLSKQAWVGGSSTGKIGSAGMYYNTNTFNNGMDLRAQKSWFFLDDAIVALGTNITGTSPSSIETTIENRKVDANAQIKHNETSISAPKLSLEKGDTITLNNGDKGTFGYYFPTETDVEISNTVHSGKFVDQNLMFDDKIEYSSNFFKLGINHGTVADNDAYEYVMLPNSSETQIQDFAKNNTLEILENNNLIQAIKTDTTFAMNVWGVDGANLEGIGVDRSASVTAHITNNRTLTIAVSDPKHVEEEIQVTITRPYKSVTKMDSNITQNGNQFTINTKDLEGASSIIELRLDTEALENAVVSEIRTLFKTIDALDLDLYTEDSSNDLVETRSRVQETVDNPDRTLEDLEDGRDQLQTSYDHLELKEIQEEPETKPETKPEEGKPDVEIEPNIDPSKPTEKPESNREESDTLPKTGIHSEPRSFAAFMIIGLGLLFKRKDS
ncbi:hyaluronidase [Erysipelothrix sp. strain 2 (EsS2-7-Brazil)]|uniref:polysaccharide lyase 8 family protein n=1 Tax=Erysipelothrix sp. strain 2 (EsS2-7-Brazil) TaxID=2500579 RepID=UPI00190D539C|nr:polysaccharide lyase 8 family protein [Erysipelothrix sp. strain 2 (EsS2-7-Brazil)]MBK2403530.1 hyaluronidase [Erysipelothrix sp. strain 2 (EsS2-7-Brazil)]